MRFLEEDQSKWLRSNVLYHNRMAEVNFQMIHICGLGVALTCALLTLTPDRSSHVYINGDYGYF